MKKLFTILSIAFLFSLSFSPVLADGNDNVFNENSAEVLSETMIMSNTGANDAEGSYAGDGGNGGDIRNGFVMHRGYDGPGPAFVVEENGDDHYDLPDGDVEDSATGNGGAGGNAAAGGTVVSGSSTVNAEQQNWVNRNTTEIDRCACDEDNDDGNTRVRNINAAAVMSGGALASNTGDNWTDGSFGGEGGEGGDISNSADGDVEGSTTGTGSTGGNSGLGGYVDSGDSSVMSSLIQRINENITRITR